VRLVRCSGGVGRTGRASRARRSARLVESHPVNEVLAFTVNYTLALAVLEDSNVVEREIRIELSTAFGELAQSDGLVSSRLVDDGSLLDGLVDGDGGVEGVVLVCVTLDDGLHDVVNVVMVVLDNLLALVHNLLVVDTPDRLVVVLIQAGEESAVLVGIDVALLDVCLGDNVFLMHGLVMTFVKNGLNVMLNVVVVLINLLLTDDLLDLVIVDSLTGNGCEVLVVVGGIGIGLRVQLGIVLMRLVLRRRRRVVLAFGVTVGGTSCARGRARVAIDTATAVGANL